MRLITAIDDNGVATRFFVGCSEFGDQIAVDLIMHGFAVVMLESSSQPPPRSTEEMERVRRILAMIALKGQPS